MIKKITQKEFIEEMKNWTGEDISFNSFLNFLLKINCLDDIKTIFDKYDIYETVKTWNMKENLKVEIKSNYLLLNDSRLDIKGKCFKYNDDILGVLSEHYLIIYYRNK